jgi:hypothetical protein
MPAELESLSSSAASVLARLDELTAAGLAGLEEIRTVVADLEGQAKGGSFDARSLVPLAVFALKAEAALVPSPVVKAVLAVVIFALGKFAPPAPQPAPAS